MKTKLGKIVFEDDAPSIQEIMDSAPEFIGLKLDYVVLGIQTYLVVFEGNPSWGAKLIIGRKFIEITDEGGTFEGPVVAQALLKIANSLGGNGPKNDEYIQFPLSLESISKYEKMYLDVRPSAPRVVTNFYSSLLIPAIILFAVVYWLVF